MDQGEVWKMRRLRLDEGNERKLVQVPMKAAERRLPGLVPVLSEVEPWRRGPKSVQGFVDIKGRGVDARISNLVR